MSDVTPVSGSVTEAEAELNAVNRVLTQIQEPMVNAIEGDPTAEQARLELRNANATVQSNCGKGWWFNRQDTATWEPNGFDQIPVPLGVISFDEANGATAYRVGGIAILQAPDGNKTYTNAVTVTRIIRQRALADLPVEALNVVVAETARIIHQYRKGQPSPLLERIHLDAMRSLRQADTGR